MSDDVQGYLPALRNRGKRKYVRFGGGFTTDPQSAVVAATIGDAIDIARCSAHSLYEVPEACAVNGNNELVES